ncbi:hypothetical protein [Winogradskyella immobilis]|uniref:Uncharacterized protein n=1 Tax=Winogradskyella immobilis TaxID=2816852 RepID=A0ABS8ENW6_9FLAO|nr:hypothetical protein [Winogradskyella immobilis]MCC1484712.1 hypothetical protein [Winogradskyella immobilis]MCG0016804.1 hypothetical protein [Winogradskyella immobilis]
MKSKLLLFIIVSCITTNVFSQANTNINQYKYVVVPLQFDFLKGKDQYRLNTLTRYLFKENGFDVYFDEQELPEDLFKNRCLAIYANVKKVKSFLSNKVQIELKDCRGNLIFVSDEASTKVKEYKEGYRIVVKEAFESIKFLDYSYDPKIDNALAQDITNAKSQKEAEDKAEIERLKKEVDALKAKEVEINKAAELRKSEAVAKQKESELQNEKPKTVNEAAPVKVPEMKRDETLKTELIVGGYRILDSDGAVAMTLLKTAAPNVYTVKGKDAIVFKQDGNWVYSENTGSSKVEKVLKIKL